MARLARCSFVLAVAACGPDVTTPAELDEVCGAPSPFRLLELDEDERLLGVRRIDERFWFVVGDVHDDTSSRVISTSECGDDPVEVARDVFWPFEHERWPGRVLACSEPNRGAMLDLDPLGVAAPRVVMADPACRGTPTDHGVVGVVPIDETASTLALVPYPADIDGPASEAIVLADPVRGDPFWPDYQVRGDDVFTVDMNHDLLRIGIVTRETVLEQSAVGEWGITPDGRVLAWRDVVPGAEPLDFPVGSLSMRDRIDGRTIRFESITLHWLPPVPSNDYMSFRQEGDTPVATLVDLVTFDTIELPGDRRIASTVSGGRLLLSDGSIGRLSIYDPDSRDELMLADVRGMTWRRDEDHMFVLEVFADQAPLWRLPLDGSSAERVANRATDEWFDIGDRIVTPLDVDDERVGDLVLIDPESLEERRIDERVYANVLGHDHAVFHERDLVYAVVDGERSGIWVARLAM
jgi:hypothetical protein